MSCTPRGLRLITPEFLALVHRSLSPGGEFFLQTDNPGYWRYMQSVVPVFFEFTPRDRQWPDAPKGRTRREIIALRGYDDQSLTKSSTGSPIIAKYTWELRYPVSLNPSATVFGLAFVEAGNTWQNVKSFNPFDVYRSAGVGVRVFLPMFGLLGLDWGYRFDDVATAPGMQRSQVHFTLGMNLGDGSALMAFRIRRADGSTLWDGGAFRDARGERTVARRGETVFEPLRTWTSPLSNATYPVEWRVRTPAGTYTVRAVIPDQELDSRGSTGAIYWEGLSDLLDAQGRRVGRGYLEMTGYATRLRM